MTLPRHGLISARLHYFQTVAQLGSIRRAAEALNVAPSAISRTLQHLEQELGAPLFERTRQRLRLTSAGEILVYHAGASVAELERARAFIGDLQGLRRGSVGIAAVESVARGLLPETLSRFWKRHPDVAVQVTTTGSQQAFEAVARGECDLAIAFDARLPKATQRLASASLRLGALVSPKHPFAARRGVRLRDFASERVILSDASLTLGSSIEAAMLNSAVELRPITVTNSIDLMSAIAVRGHGVTFQTRVGVERELAQGDLVFIPLIDPSLRPRKLMLIARAKVHLPAGPAALAAMLAEAIQRLDGR
jgi:DNA-binding transcriptional LysR family regulator